MTRWFVRTVSATLVATLVILASAAALCLVPCGLTPSAHAREAGAANADHCGAGAPTPAGVTMTGTDQSCADQHAWDAPAVDRTISRTGIAFGSGHAPSPDVPPGHTGSRPAPAASSAAVASAPPLCAFAPLRI